VTNSEIAARLDHLADLLEYRGENVFRVRAYRKAAHTIGSLTESLAAVRADPQRSLTDLEGIGADLAGKIGSLLDTGTLELLQDLERQVPKVVFELIRVPGLGPKKVHALGEQLGVHSPTDLVAALKSGRLRQLRGFGPKTEERLREALGTHRGKKERVPLAVAEREAEPLLAYMKSCPMVREAIVAGSLRRRRESVGDIAVYTAVYAGYRTSRIRCVHFSVVHFP